MREKKKEFNEERKKERKNKNPNIEETEWDYMAMAWNVKSKIEK